MEIAAKDDKGYSGYVGIRSGTGWYFLIFEPEPDEAIMVEHGFTTKTKAVKCCKDIIQKLDSGVDIDAVV